MPKRHSVWKVRQSAPWRTVRNGGDGGRREPLPYCTGQWGDSVLRAAVPAEGPTPDLHLLPSPSWGSQALVHWVEWGPRAWS